MACISRLKQPKWAFFYGFQFPGSRGFFPGKREAKIRKFPGYSLPANSREETLVVQCVRISTDFSKLTRCSTY